MLSIIAPFSQKGFLVSQQAGTGIGAPPIFNVPALILCFMVIPILLLASLHYLSDFLIIISF